MKKLATWRGSSPKSDSSHCLCSQPQRPGARLDFVGSQADLGNEQPRNSQERTHWLPQTLVLQFKPKRGGKGRCSGPCPIASLNEFQTSARLRVRLLRPSKRAEFRIKVISEVTWIKAASKGPSSPKAARPMPSVHRPTIALLSGCSERNSADAAVSRTFSTATPSAQTIRCTSGRPKVSVPVLSITTISTRPRVSRWTPPD